MITHVSKVLQLVKIVELILVQTIDGKSCVILVMNISGNMGDFQKGGLIKMPKITLMYGEAI